MRIETIEACAKELVDLRDNFATRYPDLRNMEAFEHHLLE